jgi:hypothetical protein
MQTGPSSRAIRGLPAAGVSETYAGGRPGTALLFKDDRVLHGRDSFAESRWLQRAYFTDSLDPLRKATRSDPHAFAFDAGALLCA